MTPEEYLGQTKALDVEMSRIREILNQHAYAKATGVTSDAAPRIQKTYAELEDVIQRIRELERRFWGDIIP